MSVSLNLLPDVVNPLQVNIPSNTANAALTTGESIIVKFSFPTTTNNVYVGPFSYGSPGLNYKQFIGVQFPSTMTELGFDQLSSSAVKYGCALTDGTNTYSVSAVAPVTSPIVSTLAVESSIAYCRLDDNSNNVPLKTGPSIVYTLTISLSIKTSTVFVRNVGLFTSTTNNPEKVIIDSLPVLGTMAIYGDVVAATPVLNQQTSSIIVTQGPSAAASGSTVYPYNTFDLYLTLKSSTFITAADHLIVFRYPSNVVSGPTAVLTNQAAANDPLQVAIGGTLSLSAFGTNAVYLGGLTENLIPNRQFQVVLKSWKALDNQIAQAGNLEIFVLYKNTYSMLSYVSTPTFTVSQATITASVSHPEFWDIYRNGAWPFLFKFSSNTDLTSGGFVVIQQNNTNDAAITGNKFSFIASTCDFSGNDSSFDNTFGKRPVCHPLRNANTFTYSASAYNGSGVFFKIASTITGSKTYSVQIWLMADNCGSSAFDPTKASGSGGPAYVTPSFTITVYKSINTSAVDEARFTTATGFTQSTLAVSSSTTFTGKCWNNQIIDTSATAPYIFNPATAAPAGIYATNTLTTTTGNGQILYGEVYDWNIATYTSTTPAASTAAGSLTPAYLYSSTSGNVLTAGSYFLAYFALKNSSPPVATDIIMNYLPLPLAFSGSPAALNIVPGKVVFQFPYQWFTTTGANSLTTTGTPCYGAWAADDGTLTQKSVIIPATGTGSIAQQNGSATPWATYANANFFAANVPWNSSTQQQIDTSSTNLSGTAPTSNATIMRLVSAYSAGGIASPSPNIPWSYWLQFNAPTSTSAPQTTKTIAFASTCVTWNTSTMPTIKSPYTYIDIQIQYMYLAGSGTPTGLGVPVSNIRMIKLFPEGGVFNDPASKYGGTPDNFSAATGSPLISHTAWVYTTEMAVCLLELTGTSIQNIGDSGVSTTFSLWLLYATLLESDYNDQSATYPTSALSSLSVYGLASAPAFNDLIAAATPSADANAGNAWLNASSGTSPSIVYSLPFKSLFSYVTTNSKKSSYLFYLGSQLLFTGASANAVVTTATSGTYPPLFIPYYCPKQLGVTAGSGASQANSLPTIVGGWMTYSAYNSVTSINRIYYFTQTTGSLSIPVFFGNVASQKTGTFGSSGLNLATLRWNPYLTTPANILYIYNGSVQANAAGTAVPCTGFSLLFVSGIAIDSTVSTFTYSVAFTTQGKYSSSKNYYTLGKQFNQAIFGGGLTTGISLTGVNPVVSTTNTPTASLSITGLIRPTSDSFSVSGTLTTVDKIAFFCESAAATNNSYLTNYYSAVGYFILDFSPATASTTVTWTGITLAFDKTDVAKGDPAGNFKLQFTVPANTSMPIGSTLTFTAAGSIFTGNTICGLVYPSRSIVTECTTSSGSVTCNVGVATSTAFTICCYNIAMTDPVGLATLTANYPVSSTVQAYVSSTLFTAAGQISPTNSFQFTTGNSALTDIIGTKYPTVSGISYSQTNQEAGIGKVTFTVSLPREPVRNSKISFLGDFSGFVIPSNVPRCYASFSSTTFGSSWDNGDWLVDTCSTNALSSTTPLVITFKNYVYKCGITFSKTLYVSLWPVLVVNWANTAVNSSFKINMQLLSTDAIAMQNQSFTMTLSTATGAKPVALAQWDTLCAVTSITPAIPGEPAADYTFSFDLDTNKSVLTGTAAGSPNEVTIFWPYAYYGSYHKNVLCSYGGALVNCNYTDEGILNVRLPSALPVGSGTKQAITVMGIKNPAFDTAYSFPCTINQTVFSTNVRTVLVTGSGKLASLAFPTSVVMGNLRFYSVSTNYATDKNPRNTSTHTLRIGFDTAVSITTIPVTITNTPVLYVYFPEDYKLAYYSTKPSATINEWTNDTNNNITQTSTLTPSVTVSGNRIALTLSSTSYTFGTNWRYWDVIISNVVNPPDSTVQTGPPVTQTTRMFSVTLTNSNYSNIYRSHTNLNTYWSDALTTSVNSYLQWNRGTTFNFDQTRWVVDIYQTLGSWSNLTVKAGRFLQANFLVKANSSVTIFPAYTTITIDPTQSTFKTSLSSYQVSSAYNQALSFYVGCACGTTVGYYIVNFNSSNSSNFAPTVPVTILVDVSSKATIATGTVPTVPVSGSAWIGYILSEVNYDPLTVTWTAGTNNKNDPTAAFTNVVIPSATVTPTTSYAGVQWPVASLFSITSTSTTLSSQTFQTADPNNCFTFSGTTGVSFTVSGSLAAVTSSLNLSASFVYTNASNDTTVSSKNSIKWVFTPPASPIYLYCALVCITQSYPADSVIMAPTAANTPLIQFYQTHVTSSSPFSFFWNNLVRGQQYHMRCILQSTNAAASSATTASVNFETYGTATTNVTNAITTPNPTMTQCMNFLFTTEPGSTARQQLVNYCQKLYSNPGWSANGCVICTFSDLSYVPSGLAFPTNITCPASTSKSRLRFLQSSTAAAITNTIVSNITLTAVSVSVCPVPGRLCSTDVNGAKLYNDWFTELGTDLKTAALQLTNIGLVNVPLNTTVPYTITTDTTVPNLSNWGVTVTSSSLTGAVSWTGSFTSGLYCYWQIQPSTSTAPTFAAIQGCTDPSWCGTNRFSTTTQSYSTNANSLKAFTAGTTYNIYYACTNDIPGSQQNSIVQSAGTFTFPSNTPTPTNNTCPNPNKTYPNCTSTYIQYSIMVLLILLGILFN